MPKITLTEAKNDGLLTDNGRQLVPKTTADGTDLKFNDFSNFEVKFVSSEISAGGFFEGSYEVCTMELRAADDLQDLATLINNSITVGADYSDHYSEMLSPEPITEVQTKNLNQSICSYDVYTQFNYMSDKYDTFTDSLDENEIVSLYSKNPAFAADFLKNTDFPLGNSSYYPPNLENVESKLPGTSRVLVPLNTNPEADLNQYPYYNQIKVTNKVDSKLSKFLDKLGISQLFLATYVDYPKTSIKFNLKNKQSVYLNTDVQVLDLGFLAMAAANDFLSPEIDKFFLTSEMQNIGQSPIIKAYRKALFSGFIKQYGIDNFRRFEEIYNRDTCYHEDYAVSVEKYANGNAFGTPQQIYYAPSVGEISVVSDTQIKYGKTYSYKCDTHYIVVGNKYTYRNVQYYPAQSQEEREYATVEVFNRPHIIIVPVHSFTESIVAIQPPPLPPQVHFVTQNNSKNLIQMYLSPTKGHMFEKFTQITTDDQQQLDLMGLNKRGRGETYRFHTMREGGLYEIFRMPHPPKSLKDFQNFRLSRIRMPYTTSDALFQDNIRPNTKYYYLFRNVNAKGLVSNPTTIYETELLIDADDSKVVTKEYNIPEMPLSKPIHKFQSLFQIKPAMQQIYFNPDQSALFGRSSLAGVLNELTLGQAAKSIWGRKFKFRIRSATTGKIIDYNVTFTLTKDKTEEDF